MGNVEVRKNKEGYELNLNVLIHSHLATELCLCSVHCDTSHNWNSTVSLYYLSFEVRKNEEGYELNLNTLIYSELLMSNVSFLVTNQICRVPVFVCPRYF